MASIDKQSVRNEFEKIVTSFDEQVQAGKVSPETAALVRTLMSLMNIILAVFMEKKTKKTPRNSGIPSSQTQEDKSSPSSMVRQDNKWRVDTSMAYNTRTVEVTQVLEVEDCTTCGEDLRSVPCSAVERRTRIDILFEKTVEHYDAKVKACPTCGVSVKGSFPEQIAGPIQYGSGIKAYALNLLVAQMVPLNRVVTLLGSLLGHRLSEATLLGYMMKLYTLLEPWEASAKAALQAMACIHTDETSFRVNKKNHWIHVYASGHITLKCLHPKRGKAAMNDIAIIPKYGGVIIHDCWASYLSYDHCGHGLCGSHLLRELTFIIEANGYRWAKNMKKILQGACKAVNEAQEDCLSEKAYKTLQRRYRNVLTRGMKEMPAIPANPKGKRGKIAKTDAHNLCERLIAHERAVLLFAQQSEVAFTNNRAERDLRMSKVKQKVSGCFRQTQYAKAYCRISSYLQTMANKGVNPFTAINMALTGKIDEG